MTQDNKELITLACELQSEIVYSRIPAAGKERLLEPLHTFIERLVVWEEKKEPEEKEKQPEKEEIDKSSALLQNYRIWMKTENSIVLKVYTGGIVISEDTANCVKKDDDLFWLVGKADGTSTYHYKLIAFGTGEISERVRMNKLVEDINNKYDNDHTLVIIGPSNYQVK